MALKYTMHTLSFTDIFLCVVACFVTLYLLDLENVHLAFGQKHSRRTNTVQYQPACFALDPDGPLILLTVQVVKASKDI